MWNKLWDWSGTLDGYRLLGRTGWEGEEETFSLVHGCDGFVDPICNLFVDYRSGLEGWPVWGML